MTENNNKAKAEEIVNRFFKIKNMEFYHAKQCALIYVDGVIQELEGLHKRILCSIDEDIIEERITEYKAIRSEIENFKGTNG